ncbi:hypothetical protein ACVH9Z_31245 [Rhodococcus opacus]
MRELCKALTVEPAQSSKAGSSSGYLIIGSDVIEDMSALFEASGPCCSTTAIGRSAHYGVRTLS